MEHFFREINSVDNYALYIFYDITYYYTKTMCVHVQVHIYYLFFLSMWMTGFGYNSNLQ